MKISVISFDFWGYDAHIVKALERQHIEATHIKIGAVTHTNLGAKIINTFSKIFLGKNLKHQKRQQFVIDTLQKLGHQDQILVLNPNVFEFLTLEYIKKSTNYLITFLYDSLNRFPAEDKLHFFDKIYSFDDTDIEKYGFERLTNYNYLPFLPKEKQNPQKDVLYLTSYDRKRLQQLNCLSEKFETMGLRFKIFVIGKRVWKHKIIKLFLKNSITFNQRRISLESIPGFYSDARVILDLMRENQYGLSFRVFEAMALEKKIITDNEKIKQYDFYNPTNILVLNKDFSNLNKDFFEKPYEKLPEEIYQKYTIDNWVKQVFNLN